MYELDAEGLKKIPFYSIASETLEHLTARVIPNAQLRCVDGRIAGLGPETSAEPGDEIVDLHGNTVDFVYFEKHS